jgi:precorrin-3B C17-methyltransferase
VTERAIRTLEGADDIVGYDGYLEQVRPWVGLKRYHGSPIGQEVERSRLAITLAREGRRVALVSSGDAGVYGTAGIVFELLAEDGAEHEAERVEVVPGISAANTAAALLGAPLMSDFVTISLSDLMTPADTIERRIEAAAAGDLVVALYNPASMRRRALLQRAREILLQHRAPTTPVGLVRNASRPGQEVTITDLEHLPEHAVDMFTLVLVGNSATVRVGDRLVTRRGYQVTADEASP